jgi:hypothetical protein
LLLAPFAFFLFFGGRKTLFCDESEIVRENRSKAALFILIVQEYNRDNTKLLFARMAKRYFALQILQETIGKAVKSALAASIFLVARAAVWTDKFNGVLLRIAVQSSPAGAAHAQSFGIVPFHEIGPPKWFHVLRKWMREKGVLIQGCKLLE